MNHAPHKQRDYFSFGRGGESCECFNFFILGHDTHLLFWFSLEGGCEGPKVILLFFTYMPE